VVRLVVSLNCQFTIVIDQVMNALLRYLFISLLSIILCFSYSLYFFVFPLFYSPVFPFYVFILLVAIQYQQLTILVASGLVIETQGIG
jgi:hypothetical protein